MSLKRSGALFWFLAALLAIHKISSHSSLIKACVAAENVENVNNTTQHRKSLIPRRLPSPWRHGKLPALPPRLRSRSNAATSEPPSEALQPNTTTTDAVATTLSVTDLLSKLEQNAGRRRMDVMDSSSSDNHPRSVVWPVRLRPAAAKRFRVPTPTTPAPQVLLKLLQPKPTRPAIYSLDGFVPKPSLQKIVTTEAPYFLSRNDLQQLPSVISRRKVNKVEKNDDEEEYSENDARSRRKKPVSRYTAFARKGVPGEDYPVFGYIPQTEFHCGEQPGPGLYADPYTNCQVWHMCPGGNFAPRHSFLCPNGTIFNQKKRICDWWYNVECRKRRRNSRSLDKLFDETDSE